MLRRYIGDKGFYKHLLKIALPIMLQNGITNFVNMLDNIMVGSIGEAQMSGVAISNQLIFVFNLCLFGAVSGVGIFGAQFYGKGDRQGLKYSLRFKIILCLILTVLGTAVFLTVGDNLISFYMQGEDNAASILATFKAAKSYLLIMLIGFIPFALTQSYSSALRETGETALPMKASFVAVSVNLVFNYLLIFGVDFINLRPMGVKGAAIATVLSRFVEVLIVVCWTHKHKGKCPYAIGLFKNFSVPLPLVKNMLRKAMPLILNEAFWSMGIATVNQCYSERGLIVVAANNISQTFWNLFSVIFLASGEAIGIIIGNTLGACELEKARTNSPKFMAFSFVSGIVVAILCVVSAPFVPYLYNASDNVRELATGLMLVTAISLPFNALAHSSYFIMRSGGRSFFTFIFDGGFMWFVSVPLGFMLSRFTSLPILPLYFIVQAVYFIKGALGVIVVKRGRWIRNIV
ncbi:MAG: MATE family efflux transporter [Clostridia bacterium]|nr:MATE family efflux transporter [Clostridia bacterium]